MMNPLATILTTQSLRKAAGVRFFERGQDYFEQEQVVRLNERKQVVQATVHGTQPYEVKLWAHNSELAYSCTCPVGMDDECCKHCVAVGLAWLEKNSAKSMRPSRAKNREVTMNDVRAYLNREEKSVLINLLVNQAEDDDRFRERLFLKVARQGSTGPNLTAFRRAIDRAVGRGGFVDYRSAFAYAQGIDEVVDSIAELLQEGSTIELIDVLEHALRAVEKSLLHIDDSDGNMGGILDRLQDLHHQACLIAKPDPETLAARLFEWELQTDWDTFYGAAETYAKVLGKKGLAMYRTLAEKHWSRISPLKPGDSGRFTESPRFRLTHIMETLAKQSGDVEALVAIKAKDLSHAYNYLQIAELYQEAKQPDLALEWAERGVQAFPERTDSRLRTFLAKAYHQRNRHDEAMTLIWDEFSDNPQLDRYQLLKTHADKIKQWPHWREKALGYLRMKQSQNTKNGHARRWHWEAIADHSTLVMIFLWEKDVETAWQEAKAGGCSPGLWLQLAEKRESKHPEDAIEVYQNQIEPTLALKNNHAYQETITYLKHIHRLMTTMNRQQEFTAYIQTLRLAHKPKRNFMKLLDQQGWGTS